MKQRFRTEIGSKLKKIRERKGLTLRVLAETIGLSESLLSQIERGRVSPSIETLLQITDALGIDPEYVFRDLRKPRPVGIVRANDRHRSESAGVVYERLSVLPDGSDEHAIEAMLLSIEPGAEKGSRAYGHPGREMGFITEGRCELEYGTETYALETGDCVTFPSESPHVLRNTGDEVLRAVWIVTPPKSTGDE